MTKDERRKREARRAQKLEEMKVTKVEVLKKPRMNSKKDSLIVEK